MHTLQSIVTEQASVDIQWLRSDAQQPLIIEVQERLTAIGLLDPPADGSFGPVSRWAWLSFADAAKLNPNRLDSAAARLLLDPETALSLFPYVENDRTLAGRLTLAMQRRGHWINRHPDCVNILYIEGINPSGDMNSHRIDHFDDVRALVRISNGQAKLAGIWQATTRAGLYYVENPERNHDGVPGAARVALGQHKAWVIGTHRGSGKEPHEALIQSGRLPVYRDIDKNSSRAQDPRFVRDDYGINQHHGFDQQRVGKASAGCLVGRFRSEHRDFIAILRNDARFRDRTSYRFLTTILEAKDLDFA